MALLGRSGFHLRKLVGLQGGSPARTMSKFSQVLHGAEGERFPQNGSCGFTFKKGWKPVGPGNQEKVSRQAEGFPKNCKPSWMKKVVD